MEYESNNDFGKKNQMILYKKIIVNIFIFLIFGILAYNQIFSHYYKKFEVNAISKLIPYGVGVSFVIFISPLFRGLRKKKKIDILMLFVFFTIVLSASVLQTINYIIGNEKLIIEGKIVKKYILHKRGVAIDILIENDEKISFYVEKMKGYWDNDLKENDTVKLKTRKGILGVLNDPELMEIKEN